MEAWWLIFIFSLGLCIFPTLIFLFSFSSHNHKNKINKLPLPPGPSTLAVFKRFIIFPWHRMTVLDMEPAIHNLKLKYGPVFNLGLRSRPTIVIGSHSFAHLALIQKGAVFSGRPRPADLVTAKIFNSNAHKISSATYGQTWRLLRRNLASKMLHQSCIKSYSKGRRCVLDNLIQRLLNQLQQPVKVMDHFPYAMFSLLVFMCLGDKLDENKIKEIEVIQRKWLLCVGRLNLFLLWPKLGKILLGKQWGELVQVRKGQEKIFIPVIRARIKAKQQSKTQKHQQEYKEEESLAYVDTLIDLQLPEEKRKLNDSEMVSLCGEFLNAGTDTTATALQWIMANLVKYPAIQAKLYEEIVGVVGKPQTLTSSSATSSSDPNNKEENSHSLKGVVKEDDLEKMPYLKAVVLEGLRRHPPSHFVLPHSVTEDVELEGFMIPKNAIVNVMVAEIGWDPKIWEGPMEFKPERFLTSNENGHGIDGQSFDITGNREIKMMPFGVGRRICPGYGLALLHLEYFVANLIWNFEWKAIDGVDVDLSEKQEFTIVMKNPLCAHISPRV